MFSSSVRPPQASVLVPFLLAALASCSGSSSDSGAVSSDTSLYGLRALSLGGHPGLNSTTRFEGGNLRLDLPPGMDHSSVLVSAMIPDGATAYIDDVEIVPGTTRFDLTADKWIRVDASDGLNVELYFVDITSDLPDVDDLVDDFLFDHGISGAAYGVLKGEELVYASSAGVATDGVAATPSTIFRVASVSKPITMRAILQLVDDGEFQLTTPVFGVGGILEYDFGTAPYSAGIEDISVDDLLRHESGWTNDPNDPLFQNSGWTQEQIIDDVLDNRPLTTTPGTAYAYSNFGYLLLGRVIEKVSGETYEDYVAAAVLTPMGMGSTQIGGDLLVDRLTGEAQYYANGGIDPYVHPMSRLDSLGGWTTTVGDLARFMTRVDRMPAVPDTLSSALQSHSYFGFTNWYHTGSLPGTSAIISRINDEYSFVALLNARGPNGANVSADLRALMDDILADQSSWPNYDLLQAP